MVKGNCHVGGMALTRTSEAFGCETEWRRPATGKDGRICCMTPRPDDGDDELQPPYYTYITNLTHSPMPTPSHHISRH